MTLELECGQIWEEAESGDARKIVSIDRSCDLLGWTAPYARRSSHRRRIYEGRIRSFEAWMRRTKAKLFTTEN